MSKHHEPSLLRIFIAAQLPGLLRDELADLHSNFLDCASAIAWVPADSLHLTLRFLGDTEVGRLGAVKRAVIQSSRSTGAFSVRVSGLGAFPNDRTPRIIWMGVDRDDGHEALLRLFQSVDAALMHAGIPSGGRTFLPHITLARTRRRSSREDQRLVAQAMARARNVTISHASFRVDSLVVMRSELRPSGPLYSPLFRAVLTRPEGMMEPSVTDNEAEVTQ